MTRMVLILACASALLFALAATRAAAQAGAAPVTPGTEPAPAANPNAAEGEGTKTEEGGATKPEEGAGAGAKDAETTPPGSGTGPLSLAELTQDGFEIRATNFIPAEAVTRQSGKVTSDAFIVTLQKTGTTAVCFYTLKAYVSKKLTTIPACIVHR